MVIRDIQFDLQKLFLFLGTGRTDNNSSCLNARKLTPPVSSDIQSPIILKPLEMYSTNFSYSCFLIVVSFSWNVWGTVYRQENVFAIVQTPPKPNTLPPSPKSGTVHTYAVVRIHTPRGTVSLSGECSFGYERLYVL